MSDCVVFTGESVFHKVTEADHYHENNLGISGVWLVGGSGNCFSPYEKNGIRGIDVNNCCGHFIVGVKE